MFEKSMGAPMKDDKGDKGGYGKMMDKGKGGYGKDKGGYGKDKGGYGKDDHKGGYSAYHESVRHRKSNQIKPKHLNHADSGTYVSTDSLHDSYTPKHSYESTDTNLYVSTKKPSYSEDTDSGQYYDSQGAQKNPKKSDSGLYYDSQGAQTVHRKKQDDDYVGIMQLPAGFLGGYVQPKPTKRTHYPQQKQTDPPPTKKYEMYVESPFKRFDKENDEAEKRRKQHYQDDPEDRRMRQQNRDRFREIKKMEIEEDEAVESDEHNSKVLRKYESQDGESQVTETYPTKGVFEDNQAKHSQPQKTVKKLNMSIGRKLFPNGMITIDGLT